MYRIQKNTESNNQNSFNTINSGIDQTKQQLINYIYDRCNLFNFKYDSLEVESELPQLISKTYYVSANFAGSSCLLVFAKIKDRYHQFLVDRKTLSYNVKKLDISGVKITQVKLNLDVDIYQGTIFDGTFVQTKNEKTFIITDVYLFKGQDLTKSHLDSKLFTVKTYLESNYKEDKNNTIYLAVNMLFPLEKTRHLVESVIPKTKNFSIRGICFYPEVSGTKLLYKFGNENAQSIQPIQSNHSNYSNYYNQTNNSDQTNYSNQQNQAKYKNSDNENSDVYVNYNTVGVNTESNCDTGLESNLKNINLISETPKLSKASKILYIPLEGKPDNFYVFEMKKTERIDVYTLHAVEEVKKDTKVFLKRKQIGIAYVPNMERSKWCKETIDKTEGHILVGCKFHQEKQKWEPINISTAKRPSCVNDFKIIY